MVPMGWSLIGVLCLATQGQLPCGTQSWDPESVPSNKKYRVLNGIQQMTQLHYLSTVCNKNKYLHAVKSPHLYETN